MSKLYIMCGLAFSGKSTLARKIAEHTNSKLIAFDKLWVEKDKDQHLSLYYLHNHSFNLLYMFSI